MILFFEKIQLIFDIENWIWKYNFGTFWWTDRFLKNKSFEYIDSWPKILLFRTHHLSNSSTELMYIFISRTSVWSNEIYTCTYQNINLYCHKNNPSHMAAIELQNVRTSELFLMLQSFANKGYYSDLQNDI